MAVHLVLVRDENGDAVVWYKVEAPTRSEAQQYVQNTSEPGFSASAYGTLSDTPPYSTVESIFNSIAVPKDQTFFPPGFDSSEIQSINVSGETVPPDGVEPPPDDGKILPDPGDIPGPATYPPGTEGYLFEAGKFDKAYQAGLGVLGHAGFTPEQQYLLRNQDAIEKLYASQGKLARGGVEGYSDPGPFLGGATIGKSHLDIQAQARDQLRTAIGLGQTGREEFGLNFDIGGAANLGGGLSNLINQGLKGLLSQAAIDYITDHLTGDREIWKATPGGATGETDFLQYIVDKYDLTRYLGESAAPGSIGYTPEGGETVDPVFDPDKIDEEMAAQSVNEPWIDERGWLEKAADWFSQGVAGSDPLLIPGALPSGTGLMPPEEGRRMPSVANQIPIEFSETAGVPFQNGAEDDQGFWSKMGEWLGQGASQSLSGAPSIPLGLAGGQQFGPTEAPNVIPTPSQYSEATGVPSIEDRVAALTAPQNGAETERMRMRMAAMEGGNYSLPMSPEEHMAAMMARRRAGMNPRMAAQGTNFGNTPMEIAELWGLNR